MAHPSSARKKTYYKFGNRRARYALFPLANPVLFSYVAIFMLKYVFACLTASKGLRYLLLELQYYGGRYYLEGGKNIPWYGFSLIRPIMKEFLCAPSEILSRKPISLVTPAILIFLGAALYLTIYELSLFSLTILHFSPFTTLPRGNPARKS